MARRPGLPVQANRRHERATWGRRPLPLVLPGRSRPGPQEEVRRCGHWSALGMRRSSYTEAPLHRHGERADIVMGGAFGCIVADPLTGSECVYIGGTLVDRWAHGFAELLEVFVDAAAGVGAAIDLGGYDEALGRAAAANQASLADQVHDRTSGQDVHAAGGNR